MRVFSIILPVTVSSRCRAFSLIEVVLALAVFTVSILSIVGLMAAGLNSAAQSSDSLAISNIERYYRANLETTAYTNISNYVGKASTAGYFTTAGFPTVQNPVAGSPDTPYYTVSYTPNYATSAINSTNASVVIASVYYPYPVNAFTNTFFLFVAE